MYYFTVKQNPRYKQMTLEEFLFGSPAESFYPQNFSTSDTVTYCVYEISKKMRDRVDVYKLRGVISKFLDDTKELRASNRESLYETFYIPKRSGGLRRIDAPKPELMNALRRLKDIFENDFGVLYHTSSFAYVKNRCTVDAVKRHQANESKWFGKFDLSNFFGSTTLEYVLSMFSSIYPMCLVMETSSGRKLMRDALELAFLNGGLPQGTPISPLITNVMMIPVDHALANTLRDFNKQKYIYTRYADDFLVSSRYNFNVHDVQKLIVDTLEKFSAPFTLNTKKTRYGSSAGSNWNLGVMLNKDNQITVGHKKKKQLQSILASYIMDKKNGKNWDKNDVQVMDGYRNYYRMVEGETIDRIVAHVSSKFGVNVEKMIKEDLAKA